MSKLSGIELIAVERKEQLEKHGYTIEKDDWNNDNNELKEAAIALLLHDRNMMPDKWSSLSVEKMINKSYKDRLIIAGALIAAEIDRINNP